MSRTDDAAVAAAENPFVPEHAVEQWERRGGWTGDSPGHVTILNAWRRGEPVADHRYDADEVRFDARDEMVLLRRGGAIVTVIDGRTAWRAELPGEVA